MKNEDVAELASLLREHYSPERLDTGVTEPTVVEDEHGFRSLVVPREEMFEPFRSMRLLDAVAVRPILVVTFRWDDGHDDGTIFLMPLDTREIELDMDDEVAVTTLLDHFLSWTLGGPRDSWEAARSTPLSPASPSSDPTNSADADASAQPPARRRSRQAGALSS